MPKIPVIFYRFMASKMLASILFNSYVLFFLWVVLQTYHSVFLAGMIATIYLAVELITSIPIGHMIDRMNSTTISLISSIIILIGPLLILSGYSLLAVYSGTMLIALGVTMKGDSFSATIKKHLSQEQFMTSNSFNQAAIYSASMIGTALGGISIIYFVHLFPLILIAISIASVALSAPVFEEKQKEAHKKATEELASAIVFYRKILGFLAVAFFLNGLFMAIEVYSSGLFDIVLHSSAIFYTIFVASISIGGIIGSFLANAIKKHINDPFRISLFVLLYSPIFLILGISRSAIIDILDTTLLGLLLPLINVPLMAKLMSVVPTNIYGKIMAFLRIFIGGSTPAMAALFSFVVLYFPINVILFYIGIFLFPLAGLAFIVVPNFMKMEADSNATVS